MIISASRRTDIPAFYSHWFMNRIRASYCTVPNPFNLKQVSYVSLKPKDVDVIVFWTRNPQPLFQYLTELEARDYLFYFQFTILNNPSSLDSNTPPLTIALRNFKELAQRIGPQRVIWRYDPILFSNVTTAQFHQETYERIAAELKGFTYRSIISLVDLYAKADKRLRELSKEGINLEIYEDHKDPEFDKLMRGIVRSANNNGMEVVSCAEKMNLSAYGIQRGKCVDDVYIKEVFGLNVTGKKDVGQRKACGCVVSRDIGMYDTCLFGCLYCYATRDFGRARTNYAQHQADSPSLVGWYDAQPSESRA
jgi:hypothetical protein